MTFRTEFEEISLSGSDIVSQGQDRTGQHSVVCTSTINEEKKKK